MRKFPKWSWCVCLCSGIAAATMFMPEKLTEVSESQLRVAFDGDAVLFSDESERIFKAHGLDKFFEHERENEDTLLDHVCKVRWWFHPNGIWMNHLWVWRLKIKGSSVHKMVFRVYGSLTASIRTVWFDFSHSPHVPHLCARCPAP